MRTSIVYKNVFALATEHEGIKWEKFREGIDISPIHTDDSGYTSAFIRYAPGAKVPVHTHTGYEHIIILSGEQSDGNAVYTQGDLLISTPESQHQIVSQRGCVVLAIWEKPVRFSDY